MTINLRALRRVPLLDRLEHVLVLVDVLGSSFSALTENGPSQVTRKAAVQVSERSDQDVVRCSALDQLMKAIVCVPPALDFLVGHGAGPVGAHLHHAGERLAELRLRLVKAVELLLVDSLRSQLGGQPLELGANLVGVADLAGREPADERATMRLQLDEPARL